MYSFLEPLEGAKARRKTLGRVANARGSLLTIDEFSLNIRLIEEGAALFEGLEGEPDGQNGHPETPWR
jgi:hypothetical protein